MDELTQRQKDKLLKLAELHDGKEIAIADNIFQLDDKIDEYADTIDGKLDAVEELITTEIENKTGGIVEKLDKIIDDVTAPITQRFMVEGNNFCIISLFNRNFTSWFSDNKC